MSQNFIYFFKSTINFTRKKQANPSKTKVLAHRYWKSPVVFDSYSGKDSDFKSIKISFIYVNILMFPFVLSLFS